MGVAAAHDRRGLLVLCLIPGLSRTVGIAVREDNGVSMGLRLVLGAVRLGYGGCGRGRLVGGWGGGSCWG
ncbi:hypothetical protein RA276_29290, partial [Pseudomonas syringae pv. tagetis]